mmetsp:Transcript_1041/g.2939  ORF Transcript_1041/g.2939 Transcript_1041/m.2939 type:complete len:255 (+) Transcript_1041:475-1239(+)
MHDWTVSVTFHVFLSALMRVRPRYLADLHTVHEPLGEPLKHVHKMKCVLMCHEVDEGVTKIHTIAKIHGQINEVIQTTKTLLDEHLQKHALSVPIRDVSKHHCGRLPLWLFGRLCCCHWRSRLWLHRRWSLHTRRRPCHATARLEVLGKVEATSTIRTSAPARTATGSRLPQSWWTTNGSHLRHRSAERRVASSPWRARRESGVLVWRRSCSATLPPTVRLRRRSRGRSVPPVRRRWRPGHSTGLPPGEIICRI